MCPEIYENPEIEIIQVEAEGVFAFSNLENLEEGDESDW